MNLIDTTGWTRWDYIRFYTDVWDCSVVPVNSKKRPMVQWSDFMLKRPTDKQLKAWFDLPCQAFRTPPWGIAIVLAHDLFSIDLDLDSLYADLKARGAFPTGACIFKSARGYHAIMRSSQGVPKTVAEHNDMLIAINSDYGEIGIGGDNNHLSNMPDTPEREWVTLYDEPALVDYNVWLETYLGWSPSNPFSQKGWEDEIYCPWHEADGEHTPSLRCNSQTGGYKCHGCGRSGKFSELVTQLNEVGMEVPGYITKWLADFKTQNQPALIFEADSPDEDEQFLFRGDEEIELGDLDAGIISGLMRRGDCGVIFAPAGVGKTSVINSGVADALRGLEWWGIEGVQCDPGLKVLILDLENSPGETRAGIRAATGHHKALKNLFVAELAGRGFDIYDPSWAKWLEKTAIEYGCDIVVIDNLNTYTSSNINDPYEMKRVVTENRKLAKKTDTVVIAIHHTGHLKMSETTGEYIDVRPTGGAGLRNDANFEFSVLKFKNKKDQVRITCTKMRSRVARVHAGDEWIMRYDYDTTYLSQLNPALQMAMAMTKYLVERHGRDKVMQLLDVTSAALSNYLHGQRLPKPEKRKILEEKCKEEGYTPRLADIS